MRGAGHVLPFWICAWMQTYALMNCTSSVICTSSPTRMPPVSRAAFQLRSKSLRLIFAVAESPIRVLPHGSLPGLLGPSTANVTGLVTPCSTRSPVTRYSWSPLRSTFVDLKFMVGYFSTSKKSTLFRCASRCGSPVFKVGTSTDASTLERVESTVCSFRVPLSPLKLPFTFEIIMCFTLNSALECAGSSFQVMVDSGVAVAVAMGGLASFRSVGCGRAISVATTIVSAFPHPHRHPPLPGPQGLILTRVSPCPTSPNPSSSRPTSSR